MFIVKCILLLVFSVVDLLVVCWLLLHDRCLETWRATFPRPQQSTSSYCILIFFHLLMGNYCVLIFLIRLLASHIIKQVTSCLILFSVCPRGFRVTFILFNSSNSLLCVSMSYSYCLTLPLILFSMCQSPYISLALLIKKKHFLVMLFSRVLFQISA